MGSFCFGPRHGLFITFLWSWALYNIFLAFFYLHIYFSIHTYFNTELIVLQVIFFLQNIHDTEQLIVLQVFFFLKQI